MKDVSQELSLVNDLLTVFRRPAHFALALHLRVDEVANIVPAIGPLELTVALDLGVFEVATIEKDLLSPGWPIWIASLLFMADLLPFLVAFAVDDSSAVEVAADLNQTSVSCLDSMAFHLVLLPHSRV